MLEQYKGVMCVIGGMSIEIFTGSFFLWGNISLYVLSYYHEKNPSLDTSFIFTVETILVLF